MGTLTHRRARSEALADFNALAEIVTAEMPKTPSPGAIAIGALGLTAIAGALYYTMQPKSATPTGAGKTPLSAPGPAATAPKPAVTAKPATAPRVPTPAQAAPHAFTPTPAAPVREQALTTVPQGPAGLAIAPTSNEDAIKAAAWGTPGHQTPAQAAQQKADAAAQAAYDASNTTQPANQSETYVLSVTETPPEKDTGFLSSVASFFES